MFTAPTPTLVHFDEFEAKRQRQLLQSLVTSETPDIPVDYPVSSTTPVPYSKRWSGNSSSVLLETLKQATEARKRIPSTTGESTVTALTSSTITQQDSLAEAPSPSASLSSDIPIDIELRNERGMHAAEDAASDDDDDEQETSRSEFPNQSSSATRAQVFSCEDNLERMLKAVYRIVDSKVQNP
jgi:hypothetical protein